MFEHVSLFIIFISTESNHIKLIIYKLKSFTQFPCLQCSHAQSLYGYKLLPYNFSCAHP